MHYVEFFFDFPVTIEMCSLHHISVSDGGTVKNNSLLQQFIYMVMFYIIVY